MTGMLTIRPLGAMLTALGWAAVPAWPAGAAAAVWWTGRAELLLLSVAWTGTSAGLARVALRHAEDRAERREALLVQALADLGAQSPSRPPGPRPVH